MDRLAPLIAVVGCDGAGKSTLAGDLLAHLRKTRLAESGYLGLGSGPMGERIRAWPLIGPAVEGFFSKRATRARDPKDKIPGLGTALVLYAFSLRRQHRFRRVTAMRRCGIVVVTDRYPQTEVSGFYDGPGLSAARADGWLVKKLVARERAIYQRMASFVPTLVLRLNVDVETALARRPDHGADLLKAKVAVTPLLKFNGARIVDLDATTPYDEEFALAQKAVAEVLG
jgi:thymidylate kinase